jgi:DNA-binding NtrC family response regulator
MMTDGDVIDVADMPENLHNPPPRSHPEQAEFVPMSVVERRHAAQVLAAMNGNKVQAARILGIHRATLARLLQEDWPAGVARDTEEDAGVLPRSRHAG